MKVHIVSHTHWDREWYQPLGRFRQRLVALVDELLDEPPVTGQAFLLDGQCIVLDDYLEVRPERRAELSALLREQQLEAGPWYVLADELIPSGEALVRNLLAGRRALRGLRAESPPVLYCPDSFGHPAALPMVAQGFGFGAVILWRGYGGSRWPKGDAAWWLAPDGSRALLIHLPPDGYEFGANLPVGAAMAHARWARLRSVLQPRSRLGVVLVHNGADHHARQARRADAVAALVAAAAPADAHASSLSAFVRESLAAADSASLPVVSGEMRDSYGYAWTLQGTLGTRAGQKRTNAMVERLLVRDAEPWAAMARARAGVSRRALVNAAWRTTLECHPHDTLCGCAVDQVARAADTRWADATSQARGIRDDAMHALAGHDPETAHGRRLDWTPALIIRNSAARARDGLAVLEVETFLASVGVGPGSGRPRVTLPASLPALALAIPHQVLSERVVHSRIESPRHYPDDDLVVARSVLALVGEVPGYGLLAMAVGEPSLSPSSHASPASNGSRFAPPRATAESLANGVTEFDIVDLVSLECHADAGDLYTPSIREAAPAARIVATHATADEPLRAAVTTDWEVPGADGGDSSRVTTTVSLDAGAPFVRISVAGEHRSCDQRIRVRVRTGIANASVWADAAFGAVERRPVAVDDADAAMELPPRTAPLHRYVSLFGPASGATVYSDGLAEYEVELDGTVAITLVRAVGELSRDDLPERPGHAGWPSPTPLAQSHGPFAAEFALLLHEGVRNARTVDLIERTADDVLVPLAGVTLRSAMRLPAPVVGVSLDGTGLAFSTMKESDDGEWTVVRCVNLLDEPVAGAWSFGWPVREARLARLDETPGDALAVDDAGVVAFDAWPRATVTFIVR